ncbi:protein FAM163B [Corvus moneduloides]|uniref:Family with sequence similarity 163 member B n=1 Tax=Corvus moneduloides TaxID=1196302 RepID=A0A8U7NEU4_CORMO|nr:protein FAM163B [Corvus moneduloides]
MTAGTVVITGGILATVILLCIIAVLCYCRLQYYCCKKDESEEDEEEPDFAVHSHIPPLHCNRNVVLTNGPSLYSSSPFAKKPAQSRPSCPSCSPYEPPTSFLQETPTSFLQETPTSFLQETPTSFLQEPPTSFLQEPPTSFLQEPPTFFLQEPPEELHNGGDRVSYKTVSQEDLALPVSNLQALNPNRLSAMREAFSRSRSISTDV